MFWFFIIAPDPSWFEFKYENIYKIVTTRSDVSEYNLYSFVS